MNDTTELRKLYDLLNEDSWRRDNKFSDDVAAVNKALFNTYATAAQCEIQLSNWFQRFQQCVFGRIAAAKGHLHFCIIRDNDILRKSDQDVARIVHSSLIEWKKRSVTPTEEFSTPAHGFILAVCSHRVANAAPDAALQAFAEKIRELWNCTAADTGLGPVHWETLYLQNPADSNYVKFEFTIDFFAAAGDGRWWHDHRAPGGLLFTANSVGHMMRHREWYLGLKDQKDWVIQNAMLTIDGAAETPYGPATWLRPLKQNGLPIVSQLRCPFLQPDRVRSDLKDKDWTRYSGYLHADHSIRPEFFLGQDPGPTPDVVSNEFLQHFSYLYNGAERDHIRFIAGIPVSEQEVIAELGPVSEWTQIARRSTKLKKARSMATRSAKAAERGKDVVTLYLDQAEGVKLQPDAVKLLERLSQSFPARRR
jgi:hypothetical protein